jgi:hypothetical protein
MIVSVTHRHARRQNRFRFNTMTRHDGCVFAPRRPEPERTCGHPRRTPRRAMRHGGLHFCPEEAGTNQPGASPRDTIHHNPPALKGRNNRWHIAFSSDCSALSGLICGCWFLLPKALPWAGLSWPLRGKNMIVSITPRANRPTVPPAAHPRPSPAADR